MVNLAFKTNLSPQNLEGNLRRKTKSLTDPHGCAVSHLSVQNKVVLPEVSDPDDETESPVPHGDGGLVTEDDRLAPVPRSGELGEDHAHHEGLNDAT